MVKIDFKDHGIGIPEKEQKIVFSRFSRGSNVENKGISGAGIGLMISKKIIELHGGKIHLKSKESIGSTFSVSLLKGTKHYNEKDLVLEENTSDKANYIEDKLKYNKLILLVEDNKDLRSTVKSELVKNYKVIDTSNGKEALIIALEKNPDLIITDVMMPVMSGKELCHIIKTNFKTSHITVIMITALSGVNDKIEGLQTGADAYVEKPFNMEILKATIKNLIKSRELFAEIISSERIEKKTNESPDVSFLSKVVQLINENLTSKDFSINILAEEMGLSRSNLFRKLKGLTGMSPSDFNHKGQIKSCCRVIKDQEKYEGK